MGFDINSLLNAKTKENAAIKSDKDNKDFEVAMIDVDELIESEDNFYKTDNIDELAAAIELSGGIEQNLIVKPQLHGKYEVVAGHRRRLAILKLVAEGKEEYRKVPCRIKKETDDIKDKLSLILTNSTARQLTDFEKIKQTQMLKEVLMQYRDALREENKDKPKAERERMGRIRDIIASILDVSPTQVARMESINNNLSDDFKEELEKGNINISTAHELSRQSEEAQEQAYSEFEEKGELHIKDITKDDEKNDNDSDDKIQPQPVEVQDTEKNDKKEFDVWLCDTTGITQFTQIQDMVSSCMAAEQFSTLQERIDRITHKISHWLVDKTSEYKDYLQEGNDELIK